MMVVAFFRLSGAVHQAGLKPAYWRITERDMDLMLSLSTLRAGCLALALGMAPAVAEEAKAPQLTAPELASFKLDNGLQVVVIPDRRTPVVTHMIWYKVGSADEERGKSGLAHFLEHLLFKGTKTYPAGAFSKYIASVGGQENAFTSNDYTAYYQRVERSHLKKMMEMEADRMVNLVLTDEQVNPERKVVLEERSQRIDTSPSAQLGEVLDSTLYQNHPYGTEIIGWRSEIKKLNRKDALAFYKKYYAPNNAILIVAGDVTADEVKKLAKETYGKLKANPDIPLRLRPAEPEPIAARQVTLEHERVRQASIRRVYLVPSYSRAEGKEAEALELLVHILGSGSTSRLYQRLVIKDKIAAAAGAWYQGSAYDQTRLMFYGVPVGKSTLQTVEKAIEEEIARIIKDGVTSREVALAKSSILSSAIYARDSQSTQARTFGVALTTGSTIADVQNWPREIEAVSAADIQAVARKYLKKHRSVTGYLVPKKRPASASMQTKPTKTAQ